jgi:hypothetical protein
MFKFEKVQNFFFRKPAVKTKNQSEKNQEPRQNRKKNGRNGMGTSVRRGGRYAKR